VSLLVSAAELAVIRHHGSQRDIDLTYGELGAYVMKHEVGIDGPLCETYLRGSIEATSPDVWETEIGWSTFRTRDRLRSGPGQG
jgi:effector-binding domain-containing protein